MLKQGTRYKLIAQDIAKQIVNGNIQEGAKIKGRSNLASNYNVSPETIRKAIALLETSHVVKVVPSSGIVVISKEKANQFLEEALGKEHLGYLKHQLKNLLDDKTKLEDQINNTIKRITEQVSTSSEYKQFLFIEMQVKDSPFLNKTIEESDFWTATKGTIVAIRRGESLIVSPDPKELLLENDIIVYIVSRGGYFTSI